MSHKRYTEKNRVAWNTVNPYHQKAMKAQWDYCFRQPGYIIQVDPELSKIRQLGIEGKSIIHLCCNNGRELLSLKNLGAAYCLGIDISDEAITEAVQRAKECKIEVDFLRSDVYDLDEELFGKFDLVYMTIGGLVWLPDIKKFFALVNRLLKVGGYFFIYDSHPFTYMLPWEDVKDGKVELMQPYFHPEAWEWIESIDYYGGAIYDAPPNYQFTFTLSQILMSMIDSGIALSCFEEYENDISNSFGWLEKKNLKLPLSYIMIGQKHKDLNNVHKTNRTGRS